MISSANLAETLEIDTTIADKWQQVLDLLARLLQVPGSGRATGGDADPPAGPAAAVDELFGHALADEAGTAEDQEIAMHDEGA